MNLKHRGDLIHDVEYRGGRFVQVKEGGYLYTVFVSEIPDHVALVNGWGTKVALVTVTTPIQAAYPLSVENNFLASRYVSEKFLQGHHYHSEALTRVIGHALGRETDVDHRES